MTVLPVNVDDDLIELVDAQAAESGKSQRWARPSASSTREHSFPW